MHVEAREWGVTAGGDKFRRGQISLKHAHLELPGGLLWGQGALPEGGRHPPDSRGIGCVLLLGHRR